MLFYGIADVKQKQQRFNPPYFFYNKGLIMSEYHRLYRQQGWYFFTVVTYNREKIFIQPDNLTRLRQSFSAMEIDQAVFFNWH